MTTTTTSTVGGAGEWIEARTGTMTPTHTGEIRDMMDTTMATMTGLAHGATINPDHLAEAIRIDMEDRDRGMLTTTLPIPHHVADTLEVLRPRPVDAAVRARQSHPIQATMSCDRSSAHSLPLGLASEIWASFLKTSWARARFVTCASFQTRTRVAVRGE